MRSQSKVVKSLRDTFKEFQLQRQGKSKIKNNFALFYENAYTTKINMSTKNYYTETHEIVI